MVGMPTRHRRATGAIALGFAAYLLVNLGVGGAAEPARQSEHGAASVAQREGIPCYQGTVALGAVEGAIECRVRCRPVEQPQKRVGAFYLALLKPAKMSCRFARFNHIRLCWMP